MPVWIKNFEIDAAISEQHEMTSEITDHPVEKGADITDHVRPKPRRYTLTGLVSDDPIGALAKRRTADGIESPAAACQELLEQLWTDSEVFKVISTLKVYDNMVIESTSFGVDASTGHALPFTCTLRQLEIVTTKRSVIIVGVPRAANKSNKGNKPTKTKTNAGKKKPNTPGGNVGTSYSTGASDISTMADNMQNEIGRVIPW